MGPEKLGSSKIFGAFRHGDAAALGHDRHGVASGIGIERDGDRQGSLGEAEKTDPLDDLRSGFVVVFGCQRADALLTVPDHESYAHRNTGRRGLVDRWL